MGPRPAAPCRGGRRGPERAHPAGGGQRLPRRAAHVAPRRSHGSSWAPLLADLLGGPPLDLESEGRWSGRLVDLATATAGFRDQFYGLVPYVVDASTLDEVALEAAGSTTHVPLITAGAIDPLRSRWGIHPARFAGQSWPRPLVDREALARGDAKLSQWVDARLVPKVLVAPQTAVLEVLPDPDGRMVPSTPVVAVAVADPDTVDLVAAVLASPPASAWVFRQSAGTGLSSGALRVPARTMLQIPLPADGERWAEGAPAVTRGPGRRRGGRRRRLARRPRPARLHDDGRVRAPRRARGGGLVARASSGLAVTREPRVAVRARAARDDGSP